MTIDPAVDRLGPGHLAPDQLALDHLVVGAATLEAGVAWCEATLGITPGPGGAHRFMGTHNRVFGIASAAFPRAYLEIIAIDPEAPPPGRPRWFDLDAPALQASLRDGPRLIAWVARCDDLHAATEALQTRGADPGDIVQAERPSAHGLLRWRIGVRADGRRLYRGALPTLIEWADVHPADAMPASGVALEQLTLGGLPAEFEVPMPGSVGFDPRAEAPPIAAVLATPLGRTLLHSPHSPHHET